MGDPKVNFIIFSKDRACQLALLLESIEKLGWRDSFYVKIIYLASNSQYEAGYKQCSLDNPWAGFLAQRASLQQDLNIAMLTKRHTDFTCLSTDDMSFYRQSDGSLLSTLYSPEFNHRCTFSLRLGYNTIIQDYHLQSKQPALHKHICNNNILRWSPQDYNAYANYGYPLAVDTHIFHNNTLGTLANQFAWKTTNELESGLQRYRNEITEMWAYQHSVAVNIPMNSISGVTRAGEKYPYSTELLNENYLAGKRLDLSTILAEDIVGCHQEIELSFR